MSYFFIIGLSGGPDSVALLHWLCQQLPHERLLATHCNFHLRGEESMRDQRHCEQLCREMGINLIVKDFDTRGYMEEHHLSLELAARELRYEWWNNLARQKAQETGLDVRIAVGHHRDDSIETLLMNLMRGTGIRGMVGIPATNGIIVRPLLHMSRAEILDYLAQHHLSYITDSSNLENDATRNKIRNLLLPLMEQINPTAREGITRTIHHLQQTQRLEGERLDQLFASTQHYQTAGVTWDEWTVPDDYADPDTADMLYYHWCLRHPDAQRHGNLFYTAIPDVSHLSHQLRPTRIAVSSGDVSSILSSLSPYQYFDADAVQAPLSFRHWREGDRIQPLGMQGKSKLVSDLFSNAHFSPNRKATTWIVTDASDRILWVVGLRVAEWARLTDHTRWAWRIDKKVQE